MFFLELIPNIAIITVLCILIVLSVQFFWLQGEDRAEDRARRLVVKQRKTILLLKIKIQLMKNGKS